ncbi:MAG: hypothetical protein EBT13_03190 [Rhodobacteraceae bacterium]|nr:hypothetical protein [Paracoccaceae bacterium]
MTRQGAKGAEVAMTWERVRTNTFAPTSPQVCKENTLAVWLVKVAEKHKGTKVTGTNAYASSLVESPVPPLAKRGTKVVSTACVTRIVAARNATISIMLAKADCPSSDASLRKARRQAKVRRSRSTTRRIGNPLLSRKKRLIRILMFFRMDRLR